MSANGKRVEEFSVTPSKAINRTPAPPQTPAGRFRDQAARFAWHELPKREKEVIRLACLDLYDVHLMGDTSVAELLFALGQAGILALLGPGEDCSANEMVGEIWSNGGEDGQ